MKIQDRFLKELKKRREKIRLTLQEKNYQGLLLFSSESIAYLTGGTLILTERPVAYFLSARGKSAVLVPRLEEEHAFHRFHFVDDIWCYSEYPGREHPMDALSKNIFKTVGKKCTVLCDKFGYQERWGYKHKSLHSEIQMVIDPHFIATCQRIKSEFDVDMIRKSVYWGDYAHQLLHIFTKEGLYESDIVPAIQKQATKAMIASLGAAISEKMPAVARAGFRGQIGVNSYYPHSLNIKKPFSRGDVLVTGATAHILGYKSELERVMFLGEPTKIQAEFYNHALNMQQIAFDTICPGTLCSDVDNAVLKYMKEEGLMDYWRHHTGHAIGFDFHEGPFFDRGDHTILKEGMVMTVEPGLYIKNIGGFRLSDTVLITESGLEVLTKYGTSFNEIICDSQYSDF